MRLPPLPETLGWIALNQRANAALNPTAIYRDPLTMDDYLTARLITTPFGLYDCDVPCDGAVAVVVSAVNAARDLAKPPVLRPAAGAGRPGRRGELRRPDSQRSHPAADGRVTPGDPAGRIT